MAPTNVELLTDLLATAKRIEALLVAGMMQQQDQAPPPWRRRMLEQDDQDMIGMILNGSTAEDAHQVIKERREAYRGRGRRDEQG